MQTDRTTKALLALIALALFLNVFVPLLQPPVMNAQSEPLVELYLRNQNEVVRAISDGLQRIELGLCDNDQIC